MNSKYNHIPTIPHSEHVHFIIEGTADEFVAEVCEYLNCDAVNPNELASHADEVFEFIIKREIIATGLFRDFIALDTDEDTGEKSCSFFVEGRFGKLYIITRYYHTEAV